MKKLLTFHNRRQLRPQKVLIPLLGSGARHENGIDWWVIVGSDNEGFALRIFNFSSLLNLRFPFIDIMLQFFYYNLVRSFKGLVHQDIF